MNFHVKRLCRILLRADFYPAEMRDRGPYPLLTSAGIYSALHQGPPFFLFPMVPSYLSPHFSSFHSSLGPSSSFHFTFLSHPCPSSFSTLPSLSPNHAHTHAGTHTRTLYAGRLHRLISPHCDTFGAAACGLLIISTADSHHALLFPNNAAPRMHARTHPLSANA